LSSSTVALTVEGSWVPRTLVYAESVTGLLLFGRARSSSHFQRLAPALGVGDRAEFVRRFQEIPNGMFDPSGRVLGGRRSYARWLGIGDDE
jgi:hypothetical protein